jgi:hypothetical protein
MTTKQKPCKCGGKSKSYGKLKKELDRVFSIFIRQRDKGKCYTCNVKKDPKQMQCGHFFTRARMATRWNETNCHCQCVGCNIFKSGNIAEYAVRLEKEYGQGIIQKLRKESLKMRQYKTGELEKLIKHYKSKI